LDGKEAEKKRKRAKNGKCLVASDQSELPSEAEPRKAKPKN